MINVTEAFKNEVFTNDNRSYIYDIRITFQDDTYIDVTNENIMEQGGVVIDEAVSTDEDIGIGSCVVNKLSLTLKNFNGEYDAYDFRKANVVLKIALPINGQTEQLQRGIYIVAEPPVYNSSAVTLTCYDYMMLMDKLLTEANIVYPLSLSAVIDQICLSCGIQRISQSLITDSMMLTANPAAETTTCRQILSYIAQMNGMFCRFDALGRLYFSWFANGFLDSEIIVRKVQDGAVRTVQDNVVRISYMNNEGDVDWNDQVPIPAIYDMDMAKYDTVITGIRIVVQKPTAVDGTSTSTDVIDTYESGTDDYLISVENNPLVNADNAETILAILASRLIGLRYRKATVSHLGMPWLCAGDTALVTDSKGYERDILVSSTVFTALDKQSTTSAGASPVTNTAASFTPETIQYVKTMEGIKPVIQTLNQRIANANGLYETRITDQTGATITYLHNKPNLSESDIQIMVSDVGVLVTANGLDASPTWYGLTVDGNLIANILQVNGINADWINAGALVIYDDDDNEIFRADKSGKIFRWDMARSSLGSDGELELRDDGTDVSAALTVLNSTGLADESRLTSYGFRYDRLGTHMSIGRRLTDSTDAWYWNNNTHKVFELLYSSSSSGLTINDKTLEEWMGVAFKTGTVTIPSGTSATATQTINFSDVVPSGATVYGISLTIGSNPMPYVNSSGNVVTWISNLTNSAVTISNKTSAWTNYSYYLTVFYK